MHVAQESFAALGDPLDRPAEGARRPQQQRVFGIDEVLGAEAAADVGRDDAQTLARQAENVLAQHVAHRVNALARDMERVAAIGEGGHRAARLQGAADEAVVDEVEANRAGGAGEGGVGRRAIARFPVEGEVGGDLVPHQRRAGLQRRRDARHDRQGRVLDLDCLGAVAGEIGGLGHDHRHPVADVADPLDGQRPARRIGARRAVRVLDLARARHRPIPGGAVIGPGQHRENSRQRRRRLRSKALDAGVGVGRAQDVGMDLTRQRQIVDVVPAAAEKSIVLAALG